MLSLLPKTSMKRMQLANNIGNKGGVSTVFRQMSAYKFSVDQSFSTLAGLTFWGG